MEQRILKGSTQTLVSYPRVGPDGRPLASPPGSPQVRIGTPAVPMPSAFTAATADSLFCALDVDADEGATAIIVSPNQSFVAERDYLATTPAGHVVVVRSAIAGFGVVSGTAWSVELAEPVPQALPANTAIQGWALSRPLTAQQTATEGEGLAIWQAEIGGQTYEWAQAFRVVRRMPVSTLTAPRLTQAYPVVHTLRSRNDKSLDELIVSSWRHKVVPSLEARGIIEEDIIAVDRLEPVHAAACVLHLAEANPAIDAQFVDRWRSIFVQSLDTAMASRTWYEAPQTADPDPRGVIGSIRRVNPIGLRR